MKIRFENHNQKLEADRIIRCVTEEVGQVFHVLVEEGEVKVYVAGDKIKCYQVDGKELANG